MSATPQQPNGFHQYDEPPEWLLLHPNAIIKNVDGRVDSILLKVCLQCQMPLMFCICMPQSWEVDTNLFYSRAAGLDQRLVDSMEAVLDARSTAKPVESEASQDIVSPAAPTTIETVELVDPSPEEVARSVGDTAATLAKVEPVLEARIVTFADRARLLTSRNIPTVPIKVGSKVAFLNGWEDLATTDENQIVIWNREYPDANTAAVAKNVIGGYWMLEVDTPEVVKQIESETGQRIPPTFRVRSSPGHGHMYWQQSPASTLMGNITQLPGVRDWTARVDRQYVCGPNSIHPTTGLPYEIIQDVEIPMAPDWLVAWCESKKPLKSTTKKDAADDGAVTIIAEGSRNVSLARYAGKLRSTGCSYEVIELALLERNREQCKPPLDDDDIKKITTSICRYPAGEDHVVLFHGVPAGTAPAAVTPNLTISSTAGEHDENWEPSNLDKDRGYARPEFPREIMIGTTIYDGLVVPTMEHEQKYPELVWLPAVQICLNYLSDKVFIYQQSVNLNMYLGTISPPGKFFKSSSDQLAQKYARFMGISKSYRRGENADASVLIITPGSTEGLGVAMAGNSGKHAIMYYDELTKMVAKCRIDASSFASDMLTFYDQGEYGNVIIASKKNYTFEAGTYCFGWQFCTTEKGFETNWPKLSALGAGFEDRMFFLTTPEKPMPSKRHRAADITGGIVKTRKALDKAIDQKEYKLQDLEEVDRVIEGLDPRTQDMIFRFALWFAVDLGRDEIDNDCLHRAKKLVDFRNQAMLFLDPPTGDNRFAVLQKRMIREIRRNGGKVPYRELRRNLDADDRGTLDWQTSYNGLSTSGRIVRWSVKNKNGKTMLMAGLLIDRKDNWETEE